MSNRILQTIFEVSEPIPLVDTPWEFLGASPSVRKFPDDARGLVAILEEEYGADEIVEVGVATRIEAGNLVPVLVQRLLRCTGVNGNRP